MWLHHGGVKKDMVNSQPTDSYRFFWLLLWRIANDTEKSKLFLNLVLYSLQKSHVSVLDWSLLGKPPERGWRRKKGFLPIERQGGIWEPAPHPAAALGPFQGEVCSPADLCSLWYAQSLPHPPLLWGQGSGEANLGVRSDGCQSRNAPFKSAAPSWGILSLLVLKSVSLNAVGKLALGFVTVSYINSQKSHHFMGVLNSWFQIFFALLAALSGNSSRYTAVSICHCCSDLQAIKRL